MSGMRPEWFMEVDDVLRETERLLGHLAASKPPPGQFSRCAFIPAVDIYEREDKIVVVVEVAGVSTDRIDISVSGSTLTLRGERKAEGEGLSRTYHQMEICTGPFERALSLPSLVDPDKTEAYYSDGFLQIVLTKVANRREYRVSIRS